MSIRARIERLEARAPKPAMPRARTALDEIRDLKRDIAETEAEIRAAGGTVAPWPDDLPGDLEAVVREIRALEFGGEDEILRGVRRRKGPPVEWNEDGTVCS